MSTKENASKSLETIIATLCAPDGCEWDREQTPQTLCDYLIEESHELVDAIRHGSIDDVREELGDVFFLLYFLGHIYESKGVFTKEDVLAEVGAKMVRRHPHIFGDEAFPDLDAQLKAWETIKKAEKEAKGVESKSLFSSLPKSLPPLVKAYRIHSKAARVDFTWESDDDVERQVEAEWLELLDAFAHGTPESREHELGDILFSLVELGRRKGIKASAALDYATQRFLQRFSFMESASSKGGKEFASLSMEEKNALWDMAKKEESQKE